MYRYIIMLFFIIIILLTITLITIRKIIKAYQQHIAINFDHIENIESMSIDELSIILNSIELNISPFQRNRIKQILFKDKITNMSLEEFKVISDTRQYKGVKVSVKNDVSIIQRDLDIGDRRYEDLNDYGRFIFDNFGNDK